MAPIVSKKRRPLAIAVAAIVAVLIVLKLYSSKAPADLQEVFQSIPNDSILGVTRLLSSENEQKQDEFFKKLEKLNTKLMLKQELRLAQLEHQNAVLLAHIKQLKVPPPSMALRDKLVYLFPYDPLVKFPAYIWQLWKHGLNDARFEEKFKEGESQWAWKNPGFVHELFNDDTAHTMVKHLYNLIPEVVDAYEALPAVILKMDFFRYLILFARGGIYADIDTYPLQPIPNWIPENVLPDELGMIVSIDSDTNLASWRLESVRRLQFGQFVLQAKPGHPVLREMIFQITENTLRKQRGLRDKEALELTGSLNQRALDISRWTGAGAWTDVIMNYFNDYIKSAVYQSISWKEFHELAIPKLVSDILVLPRASFASDIEIPKDGKIDDPLAFVKHYANKIWKTT